MNKRRLFLQNIIFFIVSAVVYFISFFVVLNITRNETSSSLISYSRQVSSELISASNADNIINEFSLIDNIRVSIYEKDNDVAIADTRPFPKNEGGFEVIKTNLDKVYYQFSDTLLTEMVYYASYDKDSNLYIRVGFPKSDTEKTSMYMLYFGIIGFSVLDIIFAFYSYINHKKSIQPLRLATSRIQGIVGKKTIISKNEDDLKVLSDSIDEVGSEFKKQLEETTESQQKLNFIINSMPQGILVIDGSYKVIMLNNSAISILNIKKDKVINEDSRVLFENERFKDAIGTIVTTANNKQFDMQIGERDYMFEFSPINYKWSEGLNKHGCLVFMYDITSQKNADEMQKEFFSNASHELKSPLTSILGYQEMIKEGIISTEKELKDANERTLNEAQRMKGIVKYMLENGANTDVMTVSEHNIRKYVLSSLDLLNYEITEKHIKVTTKLDDLVIKINHDDLDKLISNLLSNAIKYNKDNGEIIILVDKSKKTLSIKDTGVGIGNLDKERIFDRFYMVDKGRSRKNDSSGIGLSIVKNICKYYNFNISVDSEINKGSIFTITFR